MIPILDEEEDVDQYLYTIKANLLRKNETIKLLREQLKEAKDEAFADTEMDKLKTENKRIREDSYRGFPISSDEYEMISRWRKKHENEDHDSNRGAICGGYTYEFIPTSIGTSGVIRCSCGACFQFQEIS